MYRSLYTPIDAVNVGRRLNNEEEKDNAKRDLFLELFSLRGSPLHYDYVRGLNEIDVVFEDTPAVLDAWHTHFRDLHDRNLADVETVWDIGRVRMLSAMAISLGYRALNQTDILQHYTPVGHHNQIMDDISFRQDLVAYLKSGIIMQEMIIEQMKTNQKSQIVEEK